MGQPVPVDDLPSGGIAVPADDLPDSIKAHASAPGFLTRGINKVEGLAHDVWRGMGGDAAGYRAPTPDTSPEAIAQAREAQEYGGYSPQADAAASDAAAHAATAMGGGMLGAGAGAAVALGGGSAGDFGAAPTAMGVQNAVSNALTYQPRNPNAAPAARAADTALGLPALASQRLVADPLKSVLPASYGPGIDYLSQFAPMLIDPALRGARVAGRAIGRVGAAPVQPWDTETGAPANPAAAPAAEGGGFGADSASAARVGIRSRIEQLPDEERAEAERIHAQHGTVDPDALERRVDASTLPVPIRLTEGQATRDPMLWDNEFNSRKANPEITARFAEQEQGLKDNLEAIRDQAAPAVPKYPTSQGQILLDTDKGIDEQWRALITSKYQRLEAEAGTTGTFPIDGPGFASNADAALSGAAKNYAQFLPASVRSMIEGYREGGPVTFGQFESDRTILANEARAAERAGNGNAAHAIGVVRDQLENVPLPPQYAHLKGLANDARGEAAARFEYMRQNPSYRAAVNDPIAMGQDSPLATNYVGTYLLGKGATSADAHVANMRDRWADHPQAQAAVAGATLDHLTGQAAIRGGEGSFAPTGYNKALLSLGLKVRDLVSPETQEQLEQLGRVAHYTKVAPGGSLPNRSGTFVAQAGAASNSLLSNIWHLGLKGAEGFLNVKAGGIPLGTAARWATGTSEGAMEARAAAAMEQARQAEVARVLRPGAGLEPREAAAGPTGAPSTPANNPPPAPGFTVDSQGNATPTGRAAPPPPTGHAPPRPPGAPAAPAAGPPPPTQAPPAAPAPSAGPAMPPPPSVPPAAPSAGPEPAAAPPPPSAGPRGRAPSPGIQATTLRIAQALDVPETAVDGRVRALTTQIERAQRLHGEAHTDAEREFHGDMITSMEKERDAVIKRNILAGENPKGGRTAPPPSAPPPPAEAARGMAQPAQRSEAPPPPTAAPRTLTDTQQRALDALEVAGRRWGEASPHGLSGSKSPQQHEEESLNTLASNLGQMGLSDEQIQGAIARGKASAKPPTASAPIEVSPELVRQQEEEMERANADALEAEKDKRLRPPRPEALAEKAMEARWQQYSAGKLDVMPGFPDKDFHAAKAAGITTKDAFVKFIQDRAAAADIARKRAAEAARKGNNK